MGLMCIVCFRKKAFDKMPAEEQSMLIATVIPKRFWGSDLSHLPKTVKDEIDLETDNGLLLWGTPGVGKTYAMAAIAKHYISNGYKVLRIHYEELCLKLRDTFNPKATGTEWQIIEPLLNCDKLFIEDLGTTKRIGKEETDFSLKTFYILLEMRIEHCRPTFITSNKNIENLTQSFDERIGDRLKTFNVLRLSGKSKREWTTNNT